MSVLNKPYELSVWEDSLVTASSSREDSFDEIKLCTIGAHDMVS